MYSTHNEGKSVVAKIFTITLKNGIYDHMTAVSKNVYFNVLNDIVKNYNNTYHKSIKMKPIDIKSDSYPAYSVDSDEKHPKFKIGNNVRISKYINIFSKGYAPNLSEEVFVVKKIKNKVPWTYVISDLNSKEMVGTFYEEELRELNREKFRTEKVIKRKGNRLYVKWKGYNN